MTDLELVPIRLADAAAFVALHHRHHGEPRGHRFSIGLASDGELVGVIIVGRPVARHYDDGTTLEVTRCSKLYAAAWRATKALGYRKLITYTQWEAS